MFISGERQLVSDVNSGVNIEFTQRGPDQNPNETHVRTTPSPPPDLENVHVELQIEPVNVL